MKRSLVRSLVVFGVALLTLYIGDNLVLRYRIWRNLQPYGSVLVKRYFAIKHKDQRVEFVATDPQQRPCAHSLLPQLGYKPCWYVSRTTVERIDM
jgi:hypothetical protein